MPVMSPHDFETAGHAVLDFLHRRLGMGLWMITRTEGDDWIVLQTQGQSYDISPGQVFRWADSFCYAMVRGDGPRVAADSNQVPAYAAAPIGRAQPIKSYVGVPLNHPDGTLFGTLCAIDPSVQPETLSREQELVEMLAAMLGSMLHSERRAIASARLAERLEYDAQTDALTRLPNRRAWDACLQREETRCRRYGNPTAVVVLDLNDLKQTNDTQGHAAGDALLVRAADALRSVMREPDVVARLGGDEFGVVAVDCKPATAEILITRIRDAFAAHGVSAALGVAMRDPATGLAAAWEEADRRMYEEKEAHKPAAPETL